jgi:inner membrane transporter RhtA
MAMGVGDRIALDETGARALTEPSASPRSGVAAAALMPIALLLAATISMQLGAVFAKSLFPSVGAQGAATLRLGYSALILGVTIRPWRGLSAGRRLAPLIAYGVSLGAMNTLFYMSLDTTPLGVAVSLEFLGPLGLALAASRRPMDFAWVALAAGGLAALLPLGQAARSVDPVGAALALGAGLCWALYIVFGRRAGADHGPRTTALGMIIAAAVFVPLGVARVGGALFAPALAPSAILLALLSSAVPYSLEMVALTRVPARVFGTLVSLSPALGALAGLVLLREIPTLIQWAGIGAIVLASLGATLGQQRAPPGS